jgi:hypothetical protein
VSLISAGCVYWLERLQPLFGGMCLVSLVYQTWLVWRRPRAARTRTMLAIWWTSLGISLAVGATLLALSLRYR